MKISVKNYKSIYNEMSININGLTVISGANSSGKSSFMQPFLILKQTVENISDSESLILNGENANLTEAHQILYKGSQSQEFSVRLEKNSDEYSKITFIYDQKCGFIAKDASNNDMIIKRKMSKNELSQTVNSLKNKDSFFKNIYKKFSKEDELVPKVFTDKIFLSVQIIPRKFLEKNDIVSDMFSFGFNPSRPIEELVKRIIHIPGIRSSPERQYKKEQYSKAFRGRFDKYTASIIYDWCNSDKDIEQNKLKELISLILKLKLGSNIKADKINEAHISLSVSRYINSSSDDLVDLSDVGFGLSQVLPILVAIIEAKKNNIIYIEQPEIHLHPAAQYKLAQILCEYVNNGKKIIVETHSSIFIQGLQTEVAKKELSNKSISLNWFTQNENGETTVNASDLDEFGAFGDWPADFDTVYLAADSAYLDAVEKSLI